MPRYRVRYFDLALEPHSICGTDEVGSVESEMVIEAEDEREAEKIGSTTGNRRRTVISVEPVDEE